MSEERFKEVFRRLTSKTPAAPAFSDLETHRAKPDVPIRFKPWMAAVGAAALVLVVVGAFGLLGGGPDLAAPDENTIDYIKLEYSSTVNAVCEGGEIVDNGGFDEAIIEIWGPNSDNLTLMVATFPDGSTERMMVEGEPGNPEYIWVEGNPEDYPSNTKLRVVRCEGTASPGLLDAFSPVGSAGGLVPFHMLGPPPGFESFAQAFGPGQEPTPTEWNGTSVLLYEFRRDEAAGSNAIDLYVTEDDRRALRFRAEQSLSGVGDTVVDYSVVEEDEVPADSVSFAKSGLTAISQVFGELGAEDCSVTIPSQAFTPPNGYPATPSGSDTVWFGKDELWTVLSTDGISGGRKSVWWSSNFTDPGTESFPDITVTYTLLNSATGLTIVNDQGTNASTPEDGLFMIVGFEPDIKGCWHVTAIYKGVSLSYVYYNPDAQDPASVTSVVPDVVGMTVNEARSVLETLAYQVAFHDSANATYEVCAQEPGAGSEIDPGEVIGMRTAPPGGCQELMDTTTSERCLEYQYLPPPEEDFVVLVFFNCGDGEQPNLRPVGRGPAEGNAPDSSIFPITYAMTHLLTGPTAAERADGFSSFFSEESAGSLLAANFQDGHLILDFTEDIAVNNASTSTGSTFFLAELYANAFQFEDVESVEFQINGSCEAFWEFLQAGPECNVIDRATWEQIQSQWQTG